MDSLFRLLLHFRSSKEPKTPGDHVVRSNSFTVQLSPTFYENRQQKPSVINEEPNYLSRQNVRYIYSSPVANGQRPTCLKMLQEPLKDVYLDFVDRDAQSVPCVIDILDNGLRMQYAKRDGTDLVDVFNEFHTIAYWAAVRCVVINTSASINRNVRLGVQMGFFPFTENGQCIIQEYSTDGFLLLDDEQSGLLKVVDHPPLFACVMRDAATSSLHCHVFLCVQPQQAITLASKLYESLKNNLSSKLRLQQMNNEAVKSGNEEDERRTGGKRKYVVCSNCKKNAANKRSTSFSHFLSKLRRLTLHKDAATNQHRSSSRRRCSTGRKVTSSTAHSIRKSCSIPVLLPTCDDGEMDDVTSDEKRFQSDDGYHSIPPHVERKPLTAKPPSTAAPHWMKILSDFGLRQHHDELMALKTDKRPSGDEIIETKSLFAVRPINRPTNLLGSCQFAKNVSSDGDDDDYEEIADVTSLAGSSGPCSVVMDADLSSSDDEELTERDSLESASSWGQRLKRTKSSARRLQIETINRMLGLAPPNVNGSRARSLSDLCAVRQADVTSVAARSKTIAKENGGCVKKDAEIVSTLEQLFQPTDKVGQLNASLNDLLNNKMAVNKMAADGALRTHIKAPDWGWATFLP